MERLDERLILWMVAEYITANDFQFYNISGLQGTFAEDSAEELTQTVTSLIKTGFLLGIDMNGQLSNISVEVDHILELDDAALAKPGFILAKKLLQDFPPHASPQ